MPCVLSLIFLTSIHRTFHVNNSKLSERGGVGWRGGVVGKRGKVIRKWKSEEIFFHIFSLHHENHVMIIEKYVMNIEKCALTYIIYIQISWIKLYRKNFTIFYWLIDTRALCCREVVLVQLRKNLHLNWLYFVSKTGIYNAIVNKPVFYFNYIQFLINTLHQKVEMIVCTAENVGDVAGRDGNRGGGGRGDEGVHWNRGCSPEDDRGGHSGDLCQC